MKTKRKLNIQLKTAQVLLAVTLILAAWSITEHALVLYQIRQCNLSVPTQICPPLEYRVALKPTDDFCAYQRWHALESQ